MAYNTNEITTKRQSRFFILSIVVSVLLSFIALVSYFSGFSNILTGTVNTLVYPINSFTSFISGKIMSVGNYFGDIEKLKEENLRLKAEKNELLKEKATIDNIRTENEQLYSYLDLKREYNKLSLVNAKIISKGSGNFLATFTIDKGTMHGVKKNMPVITSKGILGIITEESYTSSRGITLVSHNSSVGVYLARSGAPGILRGDYNLSKEGKCKITGLPIDTMVETGDPVMTSGAGEIYPRDLSVGNVTEIIKDSNSQSLTLIVTPSCDLINEESLMIITDFERVYESPQASTQADTAESGAPSAK